VGVTVTSSHVVSAAPSPSGGRLLTLFPCSSVRPFSRETVLRKLPQCDPFPRTAALHELPQPGSLPQAAVLQEQAAPARAPPGVTASFRHPSALVWGHFHGLQVDLCSTVDLHGLQGGNLPHHGLHHELQRKTLCSGVSSTSSPCFTDLGVCLT